MPGFGSSDDVFGFAIDPFSPSILYVTFRYGFLMSTDRGRSWAGPDGGPDYRCVDEVYGVWPDPTRAGAVFIRVHDDCVGTVLIKSSDHGRSWRQVLDDAPDDMAFDPIHPGRIVGAFAGRLGGRFYRSVDGGESWEASPDGSTTPRVSRLRFDPGVPHRLLAIGQASVDGYSSLYESLDSGATWSVRPIDALQSVTSFAIAPGDPRRIYAVGCGVPAP
jgi:hypothetical protein